MTEMESRYFDWLCDLVFEPKYLKHLSYRKMMYALYQTEFDWLLSLDENRANDGESLRYRFGRRLGYSRDLVEEVFAFKRCSVLEAMIGLAVRCEEHIMANEDFGDRTGQWFWNMISSLGLGSMTDDRFDEEYFKFVMNRFMNRSFESDGKGSLFTVPGRTDMRQTDIWYQMCRYLEYIE